MKYARHFLTISILSLIIISTQVTIATSQSSFGQSSSLSLIEAYASTDEDEGIDDEDNGGGDDGCEGDEGIGGEEDEGIDDEDNGGGDDGCEGDEGIGGGEEEDEGGAESGEATTTATFTDNNGKNTTTTTSCGSGGCSTAESWFDPNLVDPTPRVTPPPNTNNPSPQPSLTLNPAPRPSRAENLQQCPIGTITVAEKNPICKQGEGNDTVYSNGLNISNTFNGTLTIKKIYYDTKRLIPGASYSLTPNPYVTRPESCLSVNDNDKNDLNRTMGTIMLKNIPYSFYNIRETLQSASCRTDHVLHEADISINEKLPHPVLNIAENPGLGKPSSDEVIPSHYIVMLDDTMLSLDGDSNNDNNVLSMANEYVSKAKGAKLIHLYQHSFKGFSMYIPDAEQLNQIIHDPRISSIEVDKLGHIAATPTASTNEDKHQQIMPTGIQRIMSERITTHYDINETSDNVVTTVSTLRPQVNQDTYTNGIDADIAIIDSGISKSHPELNVYKDVTFVNGTVSGDDGAGHGSHAAGTAAARDNSIGVVGVAPGARLWAVKVCYDNGRCPISNQIAAMDYLMQHADEIDVANISLENPRSKLLDRAVSKVVSEAGITVIAAAGNSAKDTKFNSPARSPDVISVSAIADSDGKCGGLGRITIGGADDQFANFSNFGPTVDMAAPGVDILSTYYKDEYGLESGTSMAAPHVTGYAALYKARYPDASPAEVKSALVQNAASSKTLCDGNNYGYFSGDVDNFREPMIHVRLEK